VYSKSVCDFGIEIWHKIGQVGTRLAGPRSINNLITFGPDIEGLLLLKYVLVGCIQKLSEKSPMMYQGIWHVLVVRTQEHLF
jgi:hypothetical protein